MPPRNCRPSSEGLSGWPRRSRRDQGTVRSAASSPGRLSVTVLPEHFEVDLESSGAVSRSPCSVPRSDHGTSGRRRARCPLTTDFRGFADDLSTSLTSASWSIRFLFENRLASSPRLNERGLLATRRRCRAMRSSSTRRRHKHRPRRERLILPRGTPHRDRRRCADRPGGPTTISIEAQISNPCAAMSKKADAATRVRTRPGGRTSLSGE